VAIGVGAVWLLARDGSQRPWSDIDSASRAELERVLERADRQEGVR
jgi:hypothetical protein